MKCLIVEYEREWMLNMQWLEVWIGLLAEYRGTGKEKGDQLLATNVVR